MKTYNDENRMFEETDLSNNWPIYAAANDDDDDEDEDEVEDDESGDWGEVDPAGGDAPSSPGSAV